jgi:plastocyanin
VSSELTAEKFAFDKDTMTVPPGAEVTIHFNNKDAGVPHNFSLYTDSSASPPAIYSGKVITGPATITYTFTAPSIPGSYFFRCDIHPKTMIGTFVVQ